MNDDFFFKYETVPPQIDYLVRSEYEVASLL